MTIRLVVLYPRPTDLAAFEQQYVGKHLPLMRRVVPPKSQIFTYRALELGSRNAAYYRVAEIHFPDRATYEAFAESDGARLGRESSHEVSTGGRPITLICEDTTAADMA